MAVKVAQMWPILNSIFCGGYMASHAISGSQIWTTILHLKIMFLLQTVSHCNCWVGISKWSKGPCFFFRLDLNPTIELESSGDSKACFFFSLVLNSTIGLCMGISKWATGALLDWNLELILLMQWRINWKGTPPPPNSLSLVPNVGGRGSCRVGSPEDVSPRLVLVSCA
jgi:hypothetical protein